MPISTIPKEEIIGDTSLGLKLTILHGKVIIQHITPLADGRASPAQLCGSLLNPGDIIIAVNGKSLINGTIHNPVGMDRIISVLKPLSQPADDDTKEYSREVRLRIVVGEGRALLRHQEEREKQKLQDRERRKKLGLDHRDRGMDPAADLFGIGAFMGVDQHSGMPMFGHLEHPSYREEGEDEKKEEKKDAAEGGAVSKGPSSEMVQEEEREATRGTLKQDPIQQSSFTDRARVPTVQAQIAHHIQLDRQYVRNRNTSGFFSMNDNATPILRPPSPPQPHRSSSDLQNAELTNPMDIRKKRLERGTQTMIHAKSLVALVEAQDLGLDLGEYEDEDPMEVASRACGTASVRTGASRRWHRGGGGGGESAIVEESDAASRASSMDNPNINFDISTIRSGESGIEAFCDHRQLVELAANNDSWKRNVLKRLEAYAKDTEKGSSSNPAEEKVVPPPPTTSIDTLLFGGDVANILNKKKQSLALPPGEMTCMLYDLVELLESSDDGLLLPDQIFMNNNKDDTLMSALVPFGSPEKAVTFSKNRGLEETKDNANVETATNFLINNALGIWLKSFRPLPWKQRRALWPYHSSGLDGDSTIMSSRMDDNESLSMMSGTITTTQQSSMYLKDKKRNLREVIEDLELDHETRRETCRLVTFYLTQKFPNASQTASISNSNVQHTTLPTTFKLSQEDEDEAAALIDAYGSYLDIYKCLVFAGKLHSKRMVDKLVGVAKYDSQHKEAMKALQKAKVLLFYEPNMLSALLELLPSISTKQYSSNFDFITLLVSAYPDLQPWCVQEASAGGDADDRVSTSSDAAQHSGGSGGFYMEYLSTLLHHEDGNDAAKRDEALVKEWCSMLCSPPDDVATDPAIAETYRQSFFRIASRDDTTSLLYHRDLAFLMDISVQMSEFGLTLSLANEIISNQRYCRDKQALLNVLQHLCIISDKAIEGNEGELNAVLLGQVISFFNVIPPCMEEHNCEFNNVTELSKLLEKCHTETQNNQQYSPSNIDACITTISENAPPTHSLQVLSQWEHHNTTTEFGSSSSSLMSALHTCLIRGAREGVRNELSGSLLRIQRAREEGRRPIVVDNGMMMMSCWNADTQYESVGGDDGEEGEAGGFIWSSVIDGTLGIAK